MTSTGRKGWVGIDRHWLTDPELDDSAMRLMLWLDSHSPEFLAKVNYTSAGKQLGWSRNRVKRAAETLEGLGLVSTEQHNRPGGGTVTAFTLHHDVWSDRNGAGGPRWTSDTQTGGPSRTGAMVHDEARAVVHDGAPSYSTSNVGEQLSTTVPSAMDTAKAIMDDYWLFVERETGKKPVIAYMGTVKIVEAALKSGWDVANIKRALAQLRTNGQPITKTTIESVLDGRARQPGMTKNTRSRSAIERLLTHDRQELNP